jgi:hypothetical protein
MTSRSVSTFWLSAAKLRRPFPKAVGNQQRLLWGFGAGTLRKDIVRDVIFDEHRNLRMSVGLVRVMGCFKLA